MSIHGKLARATIVSVVAWCWCTQSASAGTLASEATPVGSVAEYGYGLPPDISVDGHRIDELIRILH